MRAAISVFALFFLSAQAVAVSLGDLTNKEASGGLKEALTQGASAAVAKLGKTDGFLGNPQVKIPLPDGLRQAEGLMRTMGMGKQADELVTAMNRAAESAVAEAKPILARFGEEDDGAGRQTDPHRRRRLGHEYFRRTTSEQLSAALQAHRDQGHQQGEAGREVRQFAGRAPSSV